MDGFLDHADGVVHLVVQVDADLVEDVVADVVGRVSGDDLVSLGWRALRPRG